MFVCLCLGVITREVVSAVESGARTSGQVSSMCGAGSDCGRCRATVRSIIDSVGTATVGEQVIPVRSASTTLRLRHRSELSH